LVEAGGPDDAPEIAMPVAFPQLFKTQYDWDYASEPEPALARRRIYLPRGRTLGGSEGGGESSQACWLLQDGVSEGELMLPGEGGSHGDADPSDAAAYRRTNFEQLQPDRAARIGRGGTTTRVPSRSELHHANLDLAPLRGPIPLDEPQSTWRRVHRACAIRVSREWAQITNDQARAAG
jgi:hypothetical protein